MQCRGKGGTSHPQCERKAKHLVFLFFLSRKKARKTSLERRRSLNTLRWKQGCGQALVRRWHSLPCSRHLRRPVRRSLPEYSHRKRVEVGGRVGTRAAPAVEDKCVLVTSAPCLITGSLLFSRFRGTCLRLWSQFFHMTSGPWQQLLPPNRDSSSPLE